jgi:hypothetical protein
MRRLERIALAAIVGLLAFYALMVVVGCETPNYVVAPKPAEADPQFVIERELRSKSGGLWIRVVRDKVNNKLVYVTPGSGIAVVEDE